MSSGRQASKREYTKQQWDELLETVEVSPNDLNKLVMNYLVVEGYKDAAEAFQEEAHVDPGTNLGEIEERMGIRTAIQAGDVERAVSRLNDLDSEVLDRNPDLCFHMQRQRLIELIRSGSLEKALVFAQDELAARSEGNPKYLEELEAVMALLAFEDKQQSPVGDLLSLSQRQKLASEANAAVLDAAGQEREPRLMQGLTPKLDEKVTYPRVTSIGGAPILPEKEKEKEKEEEEEKQ